MATTVLNYAVTPRPSPLEVNSVTDFTIVASTAHPKGDKIAKVDVYPLVGAYAQDLTRDITSITPVAPPGWTARVADGGFSFRTVDASGHDIDLDPVTFVLRGCHVNGAVGRTVLDLEETTFAQNGERQLNQTKLRLDKAPETVKVRDLRLSPASVASSGPTTVTWDATDGATIVIDYDGKQITHVKDDPDTPLPSAGSYVTDVFEKNTIISMTATKNIDGKPVTSEPKSVTFGAGGYQVKLTLDSEQMWSGSACGVTWTSNADTCTLIFAKEDNQVNSVKVDPSGTLYEAFTGTTTVTLQGHYANQDTPKETDRRVVVYQKPQVKAFDTSYDSSAPFGHPRKFMWDVHFPDYQPATQRLELTAHYTTFDVTGLSSFTLPEDTDLKLDSTAMLRASNPAGDDFRKLPLIFPDPRIEDVSVMRASTSDPNNRYRVLYIKVANASSLSVRYTFGDFSDEQGRVNTAMRPDWTEGVVFVTNASTIGKQISYSVTALQQIDGYPGSFEVTLEGTLPVD